MASTSGQISAENGGKGEQGRQVVGNLEHNRYPTEGNIQLQSARLAMDLVTHGFARAEQPDGNDKEGRQKHRRLTAAELAAQACDTADAMFREFSKRNWVGGAQLSRDPATSSGR